MTQAQCFDGEGHRYNSPKITGWGERYPAQSGDLLLWEQPIYIDLTCERCGAVAKHTIRVSVQRRERASEPSR